MGCAFELSCLALANDKGDKNTQIRHITLCAIYLIHCFEQQHEYDKAELCLNLSQQLLLKNWGNIPSLIPVVFA
ncbi:MAG: hypothetical protein HRU20_22465 [Pseudomonadales bacterium]|nr:hypothetical protein [Pseudomonadales bacterium]